MPVDDLGSRCSRPSQPRHCCLRGRVWPTLPTARCGRTPAGDLLRAPHHERSPGRQTASRNHSKHLATCRGIDLKILEQPPGGHRLGLAGSQRGRALRRVRRTRWSRARPPALAPWPPSAWSVPCPVWPPVRAARFRTRSRQAPVAFPLYTSQSLHSQPSKLLQSLTLHPYSGLSSLTHL